MSAESVKVLKTHLEKLQKEKAKLEFIRDQNAPLHLLEENSKKINELSKLKACSEVLNKLGLLIENRKKIIQRIQEIGNREVGDLDELLDLDRRIRDIQNDLVTLGLKEVVRGYK